MAQNRGAKVRAPELRGRGGWINTGGRDISLSASRGRLVLMDFFTFCCVNCLHVLDELRPLEHRFADVLTVVGVHSPKFEHERDHQAVLAAVERYDIRHPVLDDPDLETWKQYAIRAWPTLVLIDPEGYIVHVASGEGHGDGLAKLIAELAEEHDAKGSLRRGDGPYVAPEPQAGDLAFPGKALLLDDGQLLVTDSANHSLVLLEGDQVIHRYGTGERGSQDGVNPSFAEPQGICLLTDGHVLVADTANHLLRTLDLTTGETKTVAGTGQVWRPGDPTEGPAREINLSTPWDVEPWDDHIVIAMAGTHQLWAFDGTHLKVIAGTTGEGLRDGDAQQAYLAQPSGLSAGGDRLWFADAETSALRFLKDGQIATAIGSGLFDFGHRDGPAPDAALQHPLGVTALPDGSVAISDTYNGAVRRYDPLTDEVSTLMTGLKEPSDAVLDGEHLLVVESAAHRITRVRLPDQALVIRGDKQQTQRPTTDLSPGVVRLEVVFVPPPGQKLDETYGPSTKLTVSASPPELLAAGAGTSTELCVELTLVAGEGVLHVAASAATCDVDAEHAACHISQQDWGIPVSVSSGATELVLLLNGLAPGGRPQELEQLIERRRALGLDHYDEVWEGDYHVAPEAHSRHGILDNQIAVTLHPFAQRAGLIGSGPFNLGTPDNYRVPDRGFHRAVPGVAFVATAPVVVEILTPDDETFEKFDFYTAHGVEEVLVAYPDERVTRCFALTTDGAVERPASALLRIDMVELTAGIVWPGG